MNSIFLFSDSFLSTFPFLELPLLEQLSKISDAKYVLQCGDIRLTEPNLSLIFSNLPNLIVVKKPKDLVGLMNKGDLLVSRFAYKLPAGEVSAAARAKGHKILHYDPSGIDIRVRSCPAQYLTAKSDSLRRATLKKFPKQYKQVITTGTIHYDAAATTTVDRDEFMCSYGLDPKKKLLVLTPANPGEAWMPGLKDLYKNIVKIVQTKGTNCELVIKGHPHDYMCHLKKQPGIIHKNEHYSGKHSWEELAPGVVVIKAEEGYKSLKACDAVLNVRSSIGMEVALFNKPLININRKDFVTNWPFDGKIMLDILIKDLEKTINNTIYTPDKKLCNEYVVKEAFSGDGKAYLRTAGIAADIINGKI